MTKQEFLDQLTECLQGEVTDSELQESFIYYRDYFSEQEGLGKTDQEIVEELGSPRLIAHSIIDARGIDEMEERRALRGGRYDYESDSNAEFTVNDENDPDSGFTETASGQERGGYYREGDNPFGNGRFYSCQFGGRRPDDQQPLDNSTSGKLKRAGRQVLGWAIFIGVMILFFMLARVLFPVILLAFVIITIIRMIQQ